jgi:translation initiation factor IF-3
LIDRKASKLGIMSLRDALAAAEAARDSIWSKFRRCGASRLPHHGLWQVCLRAEKQKRQEAKKKQHQSPDQGNQASSRDGRGGLPGQAAFNLIRFLEEGDKAKVTLRFRGREMAHQELGMKQLQRIEQDLAEFGVVEQHPKLEGKMMHMLIGPKKKK